VRSLGGRRASISDTRSGDAGVTYRPEPVDTSGVVLSDELRDLTEVLAKNAHELWARLRLEQGWRWGPLRDDARKEHPSLVPYEQLPESERQADRETAMGTLKLILALGYRIENHRREACP
jgi:RyR domain